MSGPGAERRRRAGSHDARGGLRPGRRRSRRRGPCGRSSRLRRRRGPRLGRSRGLGRRLGRSRGLGRRLGRSRSLGRRLGRSRSLGRRREHRRGLGRRLGRSRGLGRRLGHRRRLGRRRTRPRGRPRRGRKRGVTQRRQTVRTYQATGMWREGIPRREGVGWSRVGIRRQHPVDPARDPLVQVRRQPAHGRRRLAGEPTLRDHDRRAVVERQPPGRHLIRDETDRVEVGPGSHLARRDLLGRHVRGGAEAIAGPGQRRAPRSIESPRDAEIGDLHASVRAHQDVLGLDVAMHEALLVRIAEPREHALEHAEQLREAQLLRRLLEPRAQRPTLEELHDDVRQAVVLEEVMDRDDVRVTQRRHHLRLAREAQHELRVIRAMHPQLLERHVAAESRVPREMHDRHAPSTKLIEDLVASDRPLDVTHRYEGSPATVGRQAASGSGDRLARIGLGRIGLGRIGLGRIGGAAGIRLRARIRGIRGIRGRLPRVSIARGVRVARVPGRHRGWGEARGAPRDEPEPRLAGSAAGVDGADPSPLAAGPRDRPAVAAPSPGADRDARALAVHRVRPGRQRADDAALRALHRRALREDGAGDRPSADARARLGRRCSRQRRRRRRRPRRAAAVASASAIGALRRRPRSPRSRGASTADCGSLIGHGGDLLMGRDRVTQPPSQPNRGPRSGSDQNHI